MAAAAVGTKHEHYQDHYQDHNSRFARLQTPLELQRPLTNTVRIQQQPVCEKAWPRAAPRDRGRRAGGSEKSRAGIMG